MQEHYLKQQGEHTKVQPLLDPSSRRELEVLKTLARGASNQQIAQEIVITVDIVICHISHIFSKLGVQNRVQAIKQEKLLDLLDEELGVFFDFVSSPSVRKSAIIKRKKVDRVRGGLLSFPSHPTQVWTHWEQTHQIKV